jgi:hypothetical protein
MLEGSLAWHVSAPTAIMNPLEPDNRDAVLVRERCLTGEKAIQMHIAGANSTLAPEEPGSIESASIANGSVARMHRTALGHYTERPKRVTEYQIPSSSHQVGSTAFKHVRESVSLRDGATAAASSAGFSTDTLPPRRSAVAPRTRACRCLQTSTEADFVNARTHQTGRSSKYHY